jgi:hypothetical protein
MEYYTWTPTSGSLARVPDPIGTPLGFGTVLVLRLVDRTDMLKQLHVLGEPALLRCPIALCGEVLTDPTVASDLLRTPDMRVGAVLPSFPPDLTALRAELTDEHRLRAGILPWLTLYGRRLPVPVVEVIHATLRHGRDCRTLQDILARASLPRRTLYRAHDNGHLPPPGDFVHLVRLLMIATELQRDLLVPCGAVAQRFQFSAESLRDRFGQVFATPPSSARQWAGWEPLLYLGLIRLGFKPAGRASHQQRRSG